MYPDWDSQKNPAFVISLARSLDLKSRLQPHSLSRFNWFTTTSLLGLVLRLIAINVRATYSHQFMREPVLLLYITLAFSGYSQH